MTDLLTMVEQVVELRKVSNIDGGEYAGPCPFCKEGKDRFRVWPYRDKPGWWCRQCDHKGDAIAFAREVLGLSDRETFLREGEPEKLTPFNTSNTSFIPAKKAKKAKEVARPPEASWEKRGLEFLHRCQEVLRSPEGRPALKY